MWFIGVGSAETQFVQSGGQMTVSQYISGYGTRGTSVTMTGGSFTAQSNVYLGIASAGSMDQSGGTVDIVGTLYLAGDGTDGNYPNAHGSYTLSGTGRLTTANTFVGYVGSARYAQTGGTHTTGYFVYTARPARSAPFPTPAARSRRTRSSTC